MLVCLEIAQAKYKLLKENLKIFKRFQKKIVFENMSPSALDFDPCSMCVDRVYLGFNFSTMLYKIISPSHLKIVTGSDAYNI